MAFKRIVVGTDGSETAERALDKAIDLAAALGAELEIVNAFRPATTSQPEVEQMRSELPREGARSAADPSAESDYLLSRAVEKAGAAGVKARQWGQGVDAASLIIDVATEAEADLIMVGNRGMTGIGRFLMGSVSNKVSHHAPCDVLIVRTDD